MSTELNVHEFQEITKIKYLTQAQTKNIKIIEFIIKTKMVQKSLIQYYHQQ